tara:strand:- start:37558 stop:38061 length:504 start_codon:yes stop_codon:yes gene_type:complete
MNIKKAKISDIKEIMKMYRSCVNGMIKNDIDQWDEKYPNKEIIFSDIIQETYYIAEINNEIIGGVNIDKYQDETYLNINWKDKTNSFLVVHRLAVKENYWNRKIGKKIMQFAEELVVLNGLKSIRLDTYSGNPKAIDFYKKLGYQELGTIDLKPNKNKYHCFEKIII